VKDGTRVEGYSTKYALTKGIERVVGEWGNQGTYVYVGSFSLQLKPNVDFFPTTEAAEADAKLKAVRKLQSLRKQIEQMERLAKKPKWQR
jgi:hypothetical protein